MPFRKRNFKKAKHPGKLALKKVNKMMRNTEKKRIDTSVSSLASTTAIITPISLTAPGSDGDADRIGNVIALESVLCNYSLRMNTADDFTNIRVMIIKDKQVSGSQFAIADLLQYTSSEVAVTSPLNLDGALRFKVLYDRKHSLNQGAKPNATAKFWRNLGGIKARYSGATAVIAGVKNTGLFIVFLSDKSMNQPTIVYQTRVRFSDE